MHIKIVTNAYRQRPFIHYYASSFILYELSSPFLNIHWFCDKLSLTGSTIQLVNGVFLLASFAGARLIYGSYISLCLWYDIFRAISLQVSSPNTPPLATSQFALNATTVYKNPMAALGAGFEVVKFARATPHIPLWTWAGNILSNLVLHVLNWYWYGKMISALRKRFDPPLGTRRQSKKTEEPVVSKGVDASGRKLLEVDGVEVRKRAPLQRLASEDFPPPQ